MDCERFDLLTRWMAQMMSRRKVVAGAAGGGLSLFGIRRGMAATEKVTLCHEPGTLDQKTLIVAAHSLPAHVAHGDYANPEGCCPPGVAVCVDADTGSGACCPAPRVCTGAVCCTPRSSCADDECGDIGDGCGGTLSCPPCTPGCAATYQINGYPFEISGEICDIRDGITGEPGANAVCTCGCPDGIAHCHNTTVAGDNLIITASCCPGDGICVTGGADNGLFGAVCCKPELELLVCNQQFRYAVGFTDEIDCLGPDGRQVQVDCGASPTIDQCHELCRAALGLD